jgi:tetratricopeptide (TPR) repeat protein
LLLEEHAAILPEVGMKESEQQSFPRWETSVFKVANANTVLSALFYVLFAEGHFSTNASTLRAGLGFDNPRDQAIFEALEDFVVHMPPPIPDEAGLRAAMDEFATSAQRLNELIPGASKRLTEFVAKNPGYMCSTWPDELIIADRAELGWVFVSKEPIIEDGLPLGTAYTFRRVAVGEHAHRGEGMILDFSTGQLHPVGEGGRDVEASMLYNTGNQLGREGRFEEALRYYEASLRIDPYQASVYNNMATAYKRMGRLKESEAGYRKALEVDPTYCRAHFRLACIMTLQGREWDAQQELIQYLQSGATLAEAETMLGDLEEANDVWTLLQHVKQQMDSHLQNASPTDNERTKAQGKFYEGVRLLDSNPEASAQAFQSAVRLDPSFGLAYRELGRVLFQLGRLEDSLRQLERATSLLPNDAETWVLYADRCVNRFHSERALKAYERAYLLDPTHYGANFGLGVHLTAEIEMGRALERAREAEQHLLNAAVADPSQAAPYFQLARLYTNIDELESAESARQTYRHMLAR